MNTTKLIRIPLAICAIVAVCFSAGCGLAETTAVAATEAASAAEQVKQGKELEEKVRNDIAAAQKTAADARDSMEAANE
jgi:outer membrane murein-binding lipoprotein Lpp